MVRKFKVRKINEFDRSFDVEIEFLDNGDRRVFGFPLKDGWEVEIDGVPKFVTRIKRNLEDEDYAKSSVDLNSVKSNVEGKEF